MKHYVVLYHKEFEDQDHCFLKGVNELDLFKSRIKENEYIDFILESKTPITLKY